MRYVVAVLVVVALGALVAWMLRREETTGKSSSRAETRSAAGNPARNDGNFGAPPGQSPLTPPLQSAAASSPVRLPPPGTKVVDVFAQLKADADRGERHAACRLGTELTRCWQIQQRLAARNAALSRSDSRLQDSASAPDQDLCEGVTASQADDAWRYLLTAALAGSAGAMSQFIVSPPLAAQGGSDEGWSAYQQHYREFLERSIEHGDVRALYAGFFAAETGTGPGGRGVRAQDPHQALVYGLALLPVVDTRTSQQIQAVLPNLIAKVQDPTRATEEANALRLAHFAGKTPENMGSGAGIVKPEACEE